MAHFTDGKKAGDVLAKADFHIHGMGRVKQVDTKAHAELCVSGAFQYGNQTCMCIKWENNPMTYVHDTRYSNVTPENFASFAKGVIESELIGTLTVDII